MLKRKLTSSLYETLSEEVKKLYKKQGDDYLLEVENDGSGGDDDPAELRRALERTRNENKEFKTKLRDLETKLEETTGIDAKKRGDIDTLEKSWKDKFEKREKELLDTLEKKDGFIRSTLVENAATKLATDLSGDKAAIMLPHVKSRLQVDLDGDAPAVKILDKDGKVSALTTDDLKKELLANKDFSSILVGSKASGSGTSKDTKQTGPGSAALDANGKPVLYTSLSMDDKKARIAAKLESNA